jgi:hypothetical protein
MTHKAMALFKPAWQFLPTGSYRLLSVDQQRLPESQILVHIEPFREECEGCLRNVRKKLSMKCG